MDKKPNVIPSKEQMNAAATEKAKLEAYETEKALVTNEVYGTAMAPEDTPYGHMNAVEMMRQRTFNQLQQQQESGVVQDSSLAEKTAASVYAEAAREKNEEQMRLRDEQLRINNENIQKYQQQANQASARENKNPETNTGLYNPTHKMNENTQSTGNNYTNDNNNSNSYYTPPTPPSVPPVNLNQNFGQNPSNIDPYILELSQPNYNAPFDVIPLPSKGKTYRNKKANVKLAYMTTADENILTSPNLLQSGEFLEILINRKILDPELRYKDLLPGDRNAIMIWLRATGYGEMYPVTLLDENDVPFDTEVNLNDLKTKECAIEPDEDGLYSFDLPIMKVNVKFKLLTCGEIDGLEKTITDEKEKGIPVNNLTTYKFERMIKEVNGSRDKNMIRDFANIMRISDAKVLDNYIEELESGIDLNITVATPGGGSVATFLPLNIQFFWPNYRV
jgi:hypothetical protein